MVGGPAADIISPYLIQGREMTSQVLINGIDRLNRQGLSEYGICEQAYGDSTDAE
jgi:hypothetical protein